MLFIDSKERALSKRLKRRKKFRHRGKRMSDRGRDVDVQGKFTCPGSFATSTEEKHLESHGNLSVGTLGGATSSGNRYLVQELRVLPTKMQSFYQEVLEKEPAIAALVAVIPIVVVLPILEGLLKMKLNTIDQLLFISLTII